MVRASGAGMLDHCGWKRASLLGHTSSYERKIVDKICPKVNWLQGLDNFEPIAF